MYIILLFTYFRYNPIAFQLQLFYQVIFLTYSLLVLWLFIYQSDTLICQIPLSRFNYLFKLLSIYVLSHCCLLRESLIWSCACNLNTLMFSLPFQLSSFHLSYWHSYPACCCISCSVYAIILCSSSCLCSESLPYIIYMNLRQLLSPFRFTSDSPGVGSSSSLFGLFLPALYNWLAPTQNLCRLVYLCYRVLFLLSALFRVLSVCICTYSSVARSNRKGWLPYKHSTYNSTI